MEIQRFVPKLASFFNGSILFFHLSLFVLHSTGSRGSRRCAVHKIKSSRGILIGSFRLTIDPAADVSLPRARIAGAAEAWTAESELICSR